MSTNSLRRTAIGVAVIAALALLPRWLDPFEVSIATRVLIFSTLAMSVNLLTGVCGLPTLGQAAFYGIGAYTAALVSLHWTQHGPLQLLAAAATGAVAAGVAGLVAVRARGVPFLMITLAIGGIAHAAAEKLKGVTNGTDGLNRVPPIKPLPWMEPIVAKEHLYRYALVVVVVVFLVLAAIVRSPLGMTFRGLRDNEPRLRAIGYHPTTYAWVAYVIAGAVAGVAGSVQSASERFVSPDDLAFGVAAMALLAVIVGGVGSMWGACLGAALVVFTRDYVGTKLTGSLAGRGPLILGIFFVLIVYLLPRGIAGRELIGWKRKRPR